MTNDDGVKTNLNNKINFKLTLNMKKEIIEKSYQLAKEQYAELGVDTDKVLAELDKINISLHCWQTDDVGGFEKPGSVLGGGGIQATGNFPGQSKNN